MLSKCANPVCSARFRSLRQGRIFNLETRTLSSGELGQWNYKVEHFWLCDSCAQAMEVVWKDGTASTRPLVCKSSRMQNGSTNSDDARASFAVGASS